MTTLTLTARPTGRISAERPERPASWLTQTGQVFKRWSVNALRQPWGLASSILQPIVWIVLFGQVFKAIGLLPGLGAPSYVTFLVPGVLMMTVLYSGAWSGTGFIDDITRGIMDRLLTSPLRRSALVTGQLLQQLTVSLGQSVIVLAIGFLAGARYPGGIAGIAMTLLAATLLTVTFNSFSNAIALITGNQVALIGISQVFVLPMTFLSSAMMAPALQPSWVQQVSKYNPMTWATEVGRDALAGNYPWGEMLWHLAALAALGALAFTWSVRAIHSYQRKQ